MRHIAEALAAQGRNGDSVLVHMSPAEVAGLQGLAKRHGTSLTVNPNTGLPEAFGLGSLLPLAAMFIPGVGPLASAAIGAGLSGVGAMIDGQDPLQAAAMGGLTGGITSGMSAAVTPAADVANKAAMTTASAAMPTAVDSAGQLINAATIPGAGSAVTDFMSLQNPINQASVGAASTAPTAVPAQAASSGIIGAGVTPPAWAGQAPNFNPAVQVPSIDAAQVAQYAPETAAAAQDLLGPQRLLGPMTGVEGIRDPSLLDNGVAWVKDNQWKSAGIAGAGLLGLNALTKPDKPKQTEYEWDYDPKTTGSTELTPEQIAYNASTQGEKYYTNPNYGYYAGGGLLGLPGSSPKKSLLAAKEPRPIARKPVQTPVKAPKYLQGGGDGMSDSIEATVEGKEPVRLADSEYVIPADVVAHFGNGSSKAGAKHLDRVIKKLRRDKTGSTKQAPQVNPSNYLPI